MYYIYILYSPSHDKYYVGYSGNVSNRLVKHNDAENSNTYTRKFRPWELAASFEAGDKTSAIKTERYIKKQKSKKLIKLMINPDSVLDRELAHLVRTI